MGRLTQTSDKGGVAFTFDLDITCRSSEAQKILKLAEKLKAYEDICDSPEKLKLIDELYLERCEEINRLKEELAEYKKLEDEGLLFQLPCKAGSTVYHVVMNRILEVENVDLFFLLLSVADNRFGKTVFLTQEEAEQALERMKEV